MPDWFLQFAAPRQGLGWVWRLSFLLACGLGAILALDRAIAGQAVGHWGRSILQLLVIGMPLGLCTLWALAHAARSEHMLTQLRSHDRVTGLPDRVQFLARTSRALPQSGVLLLLDIDNFKAFNDARGRRAGDLCLMALAQRLRELTRRTDILGRLDGGVFAVYLPGAPVEVARLIGDRLSPGLVLLTERGTLRVTISVGAVLADGLTPLDVLLRDADQALDRAKLQGRARMVLTELHTAA